MNTDKKQKITFVIVFMALIFIVSGIFLKSILGFLGINLSNYATLVFQIGLPLMGVTDLIMLPILLRNIDKN